MPSIQVAVKDIQTDSAPLFLCSSILYSFCVCVCVRKLPVLSMIYYNNSYHEQKNMVLAIKNMSLLSVG